MVADDVPATKATFSTDMKFGFEIGDKINIWSGVGTLLVYAVTELTDGGGAVFDGGGFTLTEGMTYYSSFPLIANPRDDFKALAFSYEGQTQTANSDANHVAEYSYVRAEAKCTNGSTHFVYKQMGRWIRFFLTLPKQSMTVTELTITADSPVFALDGKVDVTTGTFNKGTMSDTMTLKFDNVELTDGQLNAYMACSTYPACDVVVRVKDAEGNTYVSAAVHQNDASNPGNFRTITTSLAEEIPTGQWKKVTSTEDLTSGKYVIVYPGADSYKIFSFEKSMANAQSAAATVADMHTFAEVVPMRGQLFETCVNGNYMTIDVPEDPATIEIVEADEAQVAIEATTLQGETANGTALLKSSTKNLGFANVVVSLGADGAATIKGMVKAADFKDICTFLRGHELKVTFADVMDFAASEVGMSDTSKEDALKAFEGLCKVAKSVMAEHNYLDLMDIDRNTRVMDVFANHYEFFADASLGYDSDKAYGWLNPVGFYVENDGFSAHIPMPSSEWFDRFAASLATGSRESFVAYWKQFDIDHPEYSAYFNHNAFFGRIAEKMISDNNVTVDQYNRIAAINWTKIGQKYQTYCDDICANDPLANVYVYKKVE